MSCVLTTSMEHGVLGSNWTQVLGGVLGCVPVLAGLIRRMDEKCRELEF